MRRRRPVLAFIRILLSAMTLIAIGEQLRIQVQLGASVSNFFSYFTNLSNLLAAGVLLLGARAVLRGAPGPSDLLRLITATNMIVVGVVFNLLLRNENLGALLPWVNFVLHDLMPCAVVADWLVDPPAGVLGGRELLGCLIVPVVYLVYSLVRGILLGWYPYPFLTPDRVGGYAGVGAYAAAIGATFLLAAWLLVTGRSVLRSFRY